MVAAMNQAWVISGMILTIALKVTKSIGWNRAKNKQPLLRRNGPNKWVVIRKSHALIECSNVPIGTLPLAHTPTIIDVLMKHWDESSEGVAHLNVCTKDLRYICAVFATRFSHEVWRVAVGHGHQPRYCENLNVDAKHIEYGLDIVLHDYFARCAVLLVYLYTFMWKWTRCLRISFSMIPKPVPIHIILACRDFRLQVWLNVSDPTFRIHCFIHCVNCCHRAAVVFLHQVGFTDMNSPRLWKLPEFPGWFSYSHFCSFSTSAKPGG